MLFMGTIYGSHFLINKQTYKLIMANSLERYNHDNILARSVIGGVLSILNKSIKYDQIWDNNILEEVQLPWMYDLGSSDERLMQDNYTFFGTSCFAKKISGNFDMFPRGSIRLETSTIDSDNICNRFVQGLVTRFENGKINTYHSYLYAIPITMTFNCEVWCDNFTNMLKIEQAIREYLYRNRTFYVLYSGMKIGCCMGMPNDYNQQKNTEYSLMTETGDQKIKLTFTITVETYQPVFDKTMETLNNLRMENVSFDVAYRNKTSNKNATLYCDDIMVGGSTSILKWNYFSDYSDMCTINLEYKIDDKTDIIEIGVNNTGEYFWNVPDVGRKIDVLISDTNDIKVLKEPKIKFAISDNNIFPIVVDPGYFLNGQDDSVLLNFGIGYMDDNDNYVFIDNFGNMRIKNSSIDNTDDCVNIVYNGSIDFISTTDCEIILSDGENGKKLDSKKVKIF